MPGFDLRGVFPPIPTPFDRDEDEIDVGALRSNIGRWMKTRLRGIVVLGSNGEAAQLDEEESDRVIATARESVPRDRVLIAGTGRESTRATIAASRRAGALGADLVLVRTPSFFRSQMTTDVLVRHFTAVADASPIPVLLYNFTAVTGVNMLPEAVARLSSHPNVIGVKESNPDIGQVGEHVRLTPETFQVLVGSAQTFYASLSVGATGGILALATVAPDQCVQLYQLAREGRREEALALQHKLIPLARLVTGVYGVAGLKAALDLAGYVGGLPRPPLLPAPAAGIEEIRRQLVLLALLHVHA